MTNTRIQRYTGKNLYTKLVKELEKARKLIIAVTPFIDRDSVDKLTKLAAGGTRVYIVTLNDPRKTMKTLQYIAEKASEVQNLWCYALRSIHAKIYIVDLEKMLTGSVNLVKTANKNIENLEVIDDPDYIAIEAVKLISTVLREAKSCKEAAAEKQ